MELNQLNKKYQHQWLTGFAEGDGSWQTDGYKRSIFIINQQDPQILYKIKKVVGCGQINGPYENKNGSTYYRYRVGNLEGTKRLIEIFNGNLVLDKTQERFENYLKVYNTHKSTKDIYLSKKRHIPTLNDHWLSGFIDAEGSFNGVVPKYPQGGNPPAVRIRASLVQKDEHKTMHYLTRLLGGYFSDYRSNNTTRVFIENIKSRNKLIKYLNEHPLHSKKNVAFTRFKKLHIQLTDEKFKWRLESRHTKERIIRSIRNINKNL